MTQAVAAANGANHLKAPPPPRWRLIKYIDYKTADSVQLRKKAGLLHLINILGSGVLSSGGAVTLFLLLPGAFFATELLAFAAIGLVIGAAVGGVNSLVAHGLFKWAKESREHENLKFLIRGGAERIPQPYINELQRKEFFLRLLKDLYDEGVLIAQRAMQLSRRTQDAIFHQLVEQLKELGSRAYQQAEAHHREVRNLLGASQTYEAPSANIAEVVNTLGYDAAALATEHASILDLVQKIAVTGAGETVKPELFFLGRRAELREKERANLEIVRQRIEARGSLPVSGLEFVRLIKAGGMGVAFLFYDIYEARFVVVKVNLDAGRPEEADFIKRFRREAQVVVDEFADDHIAKGFCRGVEKGDGVLFEVDRSNRREGFVTGAQFIRTACEEVRQNQAAYLANEQIDAGALGTLLVKLGSADSEFHFYTVSYIPGMDVEDLVQEHLANVGPMPTWQVAEVLWQVFLGLQYAHRRGVVHRDLKPSNVLARGDRNYYKVVVKIIDWGIAKVAELGGRLATKLTQLADGGAFGTLFYAPKEQLHYTSAEGVTEKADVFALGAIIYHLITGKDLFDTEGVPGLESMSAIPAANAMREKKAIIDGRLWEAISGLMQRNGITEQSPEYQKFYLPLYFLLIEMVACAAKDRPSTIHTKVNRQSVESIFGESDETWKSCFVDPDNPDPNGDIEFDPNMSIGQLKRIIDGRMTGRTRTLFLDLLYATRRIEWIFQTFRDYAYRTSNVPLPPGPAETPAPQEMAVAPTVLARVDMNKREVQVRRGAS